MRKSVICETPQSISQKRRISNDTVGKAQADVTEIPYSSLVKQPLAKNNLFCSRKKKYFFFLPLHY